MKKSIFVLILVLTTTLFSQEKVREGIEVIKENGKEKMVLIKEVDLSDLFSKKAEEILEESGAEKNKSKYSLIGKIILDTLEIDSSYYEGVGSFSNDLIFKTYKNTEKKSSYSEEKIIFDPFNPFNKKIGKLDLTLRIKEKTIFKEESISQIKSELNKPLVLVLIYLFLCAFLLGGLRNKKLRWFALAIFILNICTLISVKLVFNPFYEQLLFIEVFLLIVCIILIGISSPDCFSSSLSVMSTMGVLYVLGIVAIHGSLISSLLFFCSYFLIVFFLSLISLPGYFLGTLVRKKFLDKE